MTSALFAARRLALPLLTLAALAALAACTEPKAPVPAPAQALEVRLALSSIQPQVGDTIVARVRVVGTGASAVASFTGRIDFDSTRVRFVDDQPVDGASSAVNPGAGTVRVASMAAQGFSAGTLAAVRFVATGPSAGLALRVAVEELHSISMRDLAPTATVVAAPVKAP